MKNFSSKTPYIVHSTFPSFITKSLALAPIIAAFLAIPSAQAATVYWDADADGTNNVLPSTGLGGAGNWNNSLSETPVSNWWPGSGITDQAWVNANNDTATFAGTAGTVTITDDITVGGLVFNTTGYIVTGGTLNFAGATPTITSAASVSSTLNSVLTGVNGLTTSTVGLVINNANNTISGTIKVNSGSLSTSTAGSLGTSVINLNGGTFRPRANLTNDVLVTANSTIDMSTIGSTFTLGTLTIGAKTLTILSTSGVSNGNISFGATTLTGNATIINDKSSSGTNMTSPNATFSTVTVGDSVAANTTTTLTMGASSTAARNRQMTLHGVLSDNANDPTKILALNISPGALTALTVNVDAANTYTGSTTIDGSKSNVTLRLTTGDDRLPTGTALIFGTGSSTTTQGILDLNKVNQTVGSLNYTGSGTLKGIVTNNATGSGTSTLTVSSATTDSTFAGTITNGATAKVAFTKAGAATMTLSGSNGYTGATTVSGGTLNVNGSLAAGSLVNVSNATLGGSGLVSGTVGVSNGHISDTVTLGDTTFHGTSTLAGSHTVNSVTIADGTTTVSGTATSSSAISVSTGATLTNNGKVAGAVNVTGLLNGTGTVNGALTIKNTGELAPGNSPGTTIVEGNLTLDSGARVSLQVDGVTTPGTDYDQIVVTGADSLVTLSAGSTLNLSFGVAFALNNPITLIDNQSSIGINGKFTSVTVGANTYDLSGADFFTYNSQEFALSYSGTSGLDGVGNDLILTAVPEPATWAMLVGGIGMLAFGQRIRRKRS